VSDDRLSFAFTYPYSYSQVQSELQQFDNTHTNNLRDPLAIYYNREQLITTRDGLRVDLLTISSSFGADTGDWDPTSSGETGLKGDDESIRVEGKDPLFAREPLFSGCFPDARMDAVTTTINRLSKMPKVKFDSSVTRPLVFPTKEILWVSARVHPGEVPAQHTLKGIINFLMDPKDIIAQEMRKRFVIKIVPIVNPDGVYRGHFRLDQFGQNLNRYYSTPDVSAQAPIYAIKQCVDYYSAEKMLSLYLDLHAHASKRGCFIYGNVLDNIEDQVQNMLYCRLIALNTPNFDYEGCLFSREHMTRIDPGDRGANLTAEGSGRVSNYLQHKIVHSYTLECNYNSSKSGNEVPPVDAPGADTGGLAINQQPASLFTTYPDKFTPSAWGSVGRACVIAMMDIRGFNPCSRIPKSKHKTLSRYRSAVLQEVRQRKEYKEQRSATAGGGQPNVGSEIEWRARISTDEEPSPAQVNAEKFIITNAPMLAADMGYNRLNSKRSSGVDGDSTSASQYNTINSRDVLSTGPLLRGGKRLSKPASAIPISSNRGDVGIVGLHGVSSRTVMGTTLRSSSAAAAGTEAGELGCVTLPNGFVPNETPFDRNSGTGSLHDVSKKNSPEQSISPGQPFYSSGGGRNSANYVRGSTPLLSRDTSHGVLEAMQQGDNAVKNHGSGGVLGVSNAASHSSSRGGRNIAFQAMSQVQVHQQLEYSAHPPVLNPVDCNATSRLKSSPSSISGYAGLNELVYTRPQVSLPLHAAPIKLVSKFGTRRNVVSNSQHLSSVDGGDNRNSSSKSDVVVLSSNVLSEESIPDKMSFISRIPHSKSSTLRKFVETNSQYKSSGSAKSSGSRIPYRTKLKELDVIPSILAPSYINMKEPSAGKLSPVRSVKQLR